MPKPYDIDKILQEPDSDSALLVLMNALDAMPCVESDAEFHFWCAYDFRRNVSINGLAGWFGNAAAVPLQDAYAGLVGVGATRHAEILKEAMRVFPNGEPPEDLDEYMAIGET